MSQMIHYQDDIFGLSVLTKSLDLILSTDADPEYFSARIGADLDFLDKSLGAFCQLLDQNSLLIERAEYLKLLERTIKTYIGILGRLEGSGYPRAQDFADDGAKLAAVAARQKELLGKVSALLATSLSGEAETDLVSQDELSELLRE